MPIFNTSAPAFQGPTTVTSSATQIFNTTGTPISSPTNNFPTGAALSGITIINTGTVSCWVGTSSVTASTGLLLKSGEQLTIGNGNGHLAAESGAATTWNLYAITSSTSTTVEVSLTTISVNE